jgi:catechol 2,3-dioxygenase-like lactoylglutathione lyase family enzyme
METPQPGITLSDCRTYAKLPCGDVERAKAYYETKLGLKPLIQLSPGHYLYECGGSHFLLFPSMGKASGDHDQLGFIVGDVEVAVRELKSRGVVFEKYDNPGDTWLGEIAENQYRRVAWFKDSEGNLLNVGQRLDGRSV